MKYGVECPCDGQAAHNRAAPSIQSSPYADPHFMRYLAAHRGAAPFELAAVNTDAAEPIILATGAPVMAMGGFTGDDQILF